MAPVLPLRCFLFLLPNYIHINAIMMQHFHILTRWDNTPLSPRPVGSNTSEEEEEVNNISGAVREQLGSKMSSIRVARVRGGGEGGHADHDKGGD